MISNLKRYKNDIMLFKKMLENTHPSQQIYTGNLTQTLTLWGTSKEPPFYGMRVMIGIKIPIGGNLVVHESPKDGTVFIGPDLSNTQITVYDFLGGQDRQSSILSCLYMGYSCDYEGKLWNEKVYPYCGITRQEFCDDRKRIVNTQVYKDIDRVFEKIESTFDLDITITEGQWPKCLNRKLYPMLILDFSKQQASWQRGDYNTTYKKRLEVYSMDSAKGHSSLFKNISPNLGLCTINAKCCYGNLS